MNSKIARTLLYVTVCITGAAVLVLEVTAVRVLSPYYGSSIYVLSSVLTIILAALSLGYYIGGRIADRFESHEPLYAIIASAGVIVLLANLLAKLMLPIGSLVLSVVSGPLIFGTLLFFLPAFLLGIDSPYVIKLQTRNADAHEHGRVVGTTFFWSTIGSIAGSLGTGFFLIPFLGVQMTIMVTGVVLVLLGIVVGTALTVYGTPYNSSVCMELVRRKFFIGIVAALSLGLIWVTLNIKTPSQLVTHLETDSLYSRIVVKDIPYNGRVIRMLQNDTNQSSAIYLDSHDLVFGYAQFAPLVATLYPEPDKWMLIGGGAYNIPRWLTHTRATATIDIAEIDPLLYTVAQEYFDLGDTSRIHNHVQDARVFLTNATSTYDVIFGDAFNTDYNIPTHLATKEFFTIVRSRLNDEGIFIMNYVGTLSTDAPTLTGSMYKTLTEVFPIVEMYALKPGHPRTPQNIIFIARNGTTPLTLDQTERVGSYGRYVTLQDAYVTPEYFDITKELVFTDDDAPIEYLMFKQS